MNGFTTKKLLALLMAALMLTSSFTAALANVDSGAVMTQASSDAQLAPEATVPEATVPETPPEAPPAGETPAPAPSDGQAMPSAAPEAPPVEAAPSDGQVTPEATPSDGQVTPPVETTPSDGQVTESDGQVTPSDGALAPVGSSAALAGLVAGEDYAADELVFLASTQAEAEQVAAEYAATLKSFAYGVGVLSFAKAEATIDEVLYGQEQAEAQGVSALSVGVDGVVLPQHTLSPNYRRSICAEETEEAPALPPGYEALVSASADGEMVLVAGSESEPVAIAGFTNPNDPMYTDGTQWHHANIGSPTAWASYTGAGVKVAVLDTGVDTDHPDLRANLAAARFTTPYGSVEDGHGHGTHVAGIVAATANNGQGGLGVAPGAQLYIGKVLGNDGYGYDSDFMAGINWAVDEGVDIINLSLGGPGGSQAFQTVITNTVNAGVVIIAAAGNANTNEPFYPAAYDGVIAVGALTSNNTRSAFSNYGTWVDISAPGGDTYVSGGVTYGRDIIYSTYLNGGYKGMVGTSQATPVVAGVAALVMEKYGTLRGDRTAVRAVTDILQSSAVPLSRTDLGVGRVSAARAVGGEGGSTRIYMNGTGTVFVSGARTFTILAGAASSGSDYQLFYTLDGSDPRDESSGSTRREYLTPIHPEGLGATVLKAVCYSGGVYGEVVSASFTLQQAVETIALSGLSHLAAGKSITLTPAISPASAVNKTLYWYTQLAGSGEDPELYLRVTQAGVVSGGTELANLEDGQSPIRDAYVTVLAKDRMTSDSHPAWAERHILLYPEAVTKIAFPAPTQILYTNDASWTPEMSVYGSDQSSTAKAGVRYCDVLD